HYCFYLLFPLPGGTRAGQTRAYPFAPVFADLPLHSSTSSCKWAFKAIKRSILRSLAFSRSVSVNISCSNLLQFWHSGFPSDGNFSSDASFLSERCTFSCTFWCT